MGNIINYQIYGTWLLVQFLIWGTHFVRVLHCNSFRDFECCFLLVFLSCIKQLASIFLSVFLFPVFMLLTKIHFSTFQIQEQWWLFLVCFSNSILKHLVKASNIYIFFKNSHSVNNFPPFIFGHHSHLIYVCRTSWDGRWCDWWTETLVMKSIA